jgi:hypothetical protein
MTSQTIGISTPSARLLRARVRPILFSVAFSIAIGSLYALTAFIFMIIPATAISVFGKMIESMGLKIPGLQISPRIELGLFLWGLGYVLLTSLILGNLIGFFHEWTEKRVASEQPDDLETSSSIGRLR